MNINQKLSLEIIKILSRFIFLLLAGSFLPISACSQQPETFTPDPDSQVTTEPSPSPVPTQEFISPPFDVWLDPNLPEEIQNIFSRHSDFNITLSKDQAQFVFASTGSDQAGSWTYLLVAPFYSRLDNVALNDLQNIWKTGSFEILFYDQLFLSEESLNHLSLSWGEPILDGLFITSPDQILDNIWNDPGALAIIPFEQLNPSFKVISIDNIDPFTNTFEDNTYPLSFPVYQTIIDPDLLAPFQQPVLSNYIFSKLTSVLLTGVTALVRDTAVIMEEKGVLYPADDIRDLLLSADFTHINNEVPFAEDCPPPNSNQESLYFCSSDLYIELLDSIGTDIIELSGDHFADHGSDAMLHSLDLYKQHGFLTYGGGENLQAGLDPLLFQHNGNHIAFIGCNAKPHEKYASASETNPGASMCDFEWMLPEISRLSEDGYLVIATMQHEEVDSFFSIAIQQYDFRRLADAGAVIVSGSQAHHPQGIELSESSLIHYGLGNLFFDQWYLAKYHPEEHINKDKSLIDFHYFYDGRYINTRMIPLQFIDNAHPRVMTTEEENPFLDEFYEASKWNGRWIYLFSEGYFNYMEYQ